MRQPFRSLSCFVPLLLTSFFVLLSFIPLYFILIIILIFVSSFNDCCLTLPSPLSPLFICFLTSFHLSFTSTLFFSVFFFSFFSLLLRFLTFSRFLVPLLFLSLRSFHQSLPHPLFYSFFTLFFIFRIASSPFYVLLSLFFLSFFLHFFHLVNSLDFRPCFRQFISTF